MIKNLLIKDISFALWKLVNVKIVTNFEQEYDTTEYFSLSKKWKILKRKFKIIRIWLVCFEILFCSTVLDTISWIICVSWKIVIVVLRIKDKEQHVNEILIDKVQIEQTGRPG